MKRFKVGIFDEDPDFATNFGFVDGKAIELDFGKLSLDPRERLREVYQEDLIRITQNLLLWIGNNHPVLLGSLQRNEVI